MEKKWQSTPPGPGTYLWRRTYQWESITRTIPADNLIYSERYCNYVPAERLGGEWFY